MASECPQAHLPGSPSRVWGKGERLVFGKAWRFQHGSERDLGCLAEGVRPQRGLVQSALVSVRSTRL